MSLLIRADGGTRMGTGHLMRCLALAQAWRRHGGAGTLASVQLSPPICDRFTAEGFRVAAICSEAGSSEDAIETVRLARASGAEWVVLDGYHFSADYADEVRNAGLRVLMIDDYGHAFRYTADLVLNQNLYADSTLYSNRGSSTRLLLGPRYALLRREFTEATAPSREVDEPANHVLVTLGGGDPDNVTKKVLLAIEQAERSDLEVIVIAGSSNPHRSELERAVRESLTSMQLLFDVPDMPDRMAWADLAVTAGGSTCWEAAFMGLPMITLVLADNQRRVAESLHEQGIGRNLGWHEDVAVEEIARAIGSLLSEPLTRTSMSVRGHATIDGEGADRVWLSLSGRACRLRPARHEDCRLLWQWASDPDVRNASFSRDEIPWEDHVSWFTRKMSSETCRIYIGVDEADAPVGQIRFDIGDDGAATIDIAVDPHRRGSGIGWELINLGTAELFRTTAAVSAHAYIRPENEASIRAFMKAGFAAMGPEEVAEVRAQHFARTRSSEHRQ